MSTPYKIVAERDYELRPGGTIKFVNIGTGILEMLCIHPSPVIIQEDLEE